MPSLPTLGQKPWQAILDAWLLVGHNADGTNKGDTAKADVASAVMDGDAAGGALDGTFPNPGLAATVAGAGLAETTNVLSVNVDGTTLEIATDSLRVKDGGITAAKVAADVATQAELDAHVNDATAAHAASAISILDSAADFTATDVEAALAELQTADEADEAALAAHLVDTAAAHAASAISYGGGTGMSATDVEAAIDELATEKADATALASYQLTSAKGAVNGYASLDSGGTVPDAQIPAAIARDSEVTTALGSYQATAQKGVANGYASLDSGGKVPSAQLPVVPAGANGTLASRPAAAAGNAGTFYLATDQDVLYFSTGSAWLRIGMPAGATTTVYSNTVPTGWIAYDGTALPASTGIYADLYAHLGNTTATPDTRGRILVHKGTHGDVDVLGDNDGTALANRTPKHNSTLSGTPAVGSLSVNSHTHGSGALSVSGAPGVGTLSVASHTHGSGALGVTGAPAIGSLAVSGAPAVGTLAVASHTHGATALTVTGAPAVGTLAVNSHAHGSSALGISGSPGISDPGHSHTFGSYNGGGDPPNMVNAQYHDSASYEGDVTTNGSGTGISVNVGSLDVNGSTDGNTATIGGAPAIGSLDVGGNTDGNTATVSGAPAIGTLAVSGAPAVGTLDVNGSTDGNTASVSGAPDVGTLDVGGSTDGNTATIAGSPAIGTLASGPGGTLPVDTPAFITFSVVIAKL